MKYGIAFTLLAALIAYTAIINGGWAYLLLWPALSFLLVAFAYFGAGPTVFGKQASGTLEPIGRYFLRILALPGASLAHGSSNLS